MTTRSLLLAAALAFAAGCEITEPEFGHQVLPGVLEIEPGDPPLVEVPQEVRAGEPFTVRVTTYGYGCSSKGNTESAAGEREVDVRPYDIYPMGENVPCTRELRMHLHEVSVRLEEPGAGTVRIHGRRMPGGEEVVATRTVTITATE